TEISLVPVFTSSSGALVMEQPSRNLLPGPSTPPTDSRVTDCTLPALEVRLNKTPDQQPPRDPGVQQASYGGPLGPREDGSSRNLAGSINGVSASEMPTITRQGGVETMSINMPGTLADRLAQAPPQVSLLQ